jgi:putative transposase
MPHSYVSNLLHYVFSTKERFPFIDHELESRLWPYIGGIARENGRKALTIGGTNDHVHALISIPTTLNVAKAIQLIKGGSSKWIRDQTTRGIKPALGVAVNHMLSFRSLKTFQFLSVEASH